MRIPYEIWVTTPEGEEYILAKVYSDVEIVNPDDAAELLLQDIIDKLNAPSPDSLSFVRGLVHPPQRHTREWNRQQDLES